MIFVKLTKLLLLYLLYMAILFILMYFKWNLLLQTFTLLILVSLFLFRKILFIFACYKAFYATLVECEFLKKFSF